MMPSPEVSITEHFIDSLILKRTVVLDIFCPAFSDFGDQANLLLLNDGQEAEALKVQETYVSLYAAGKIEAVVIVAIKASPDRIQEYGVAGIPDYLGRGAKALEYTSFIAKELLPFVQTKLAVPINGKRGFAGFSLGGLSAFDIVWNNPDLFDLTGVFSGSFWWRKKHLNAGYEQEQDRILQHMIRNSNDKPAVKFWLMTGTEDETSDRNHNFIIDSIDDTIDVIKELLKKGYRRPDDIFYYEMTGGKHETSSWAKAMPAFLTWAFSPKKPGSI